MTPSTPPSNSLPSSIHPSPAPDPTPDPTPTTLGGIILCGGASRRMGTDKAHLRIGQESMLQRVARQIAQAVRTPLVVVAAPGQTVPPLPCPARVVHDRCPRMGPLEGIHQGLQALPEGIAAAFITGCDYPLLAPSFVLCLATHLGNSDCAVPYHEQRLHPLAAIYRRPAGPLAAQLLEQGEHRAQALVRQLNSQTVPSARLRAADPQLLSLRNVNAPNDYQEILKWLAGREKPA